MTVIWVVLGVFVVIIWGITIWDILRSHLGRAKTAAWLLIVVLLPFVGSIGYWVMRKPTADEIEHGSVAERDRISEAQRGTEPNNRVGF